MSDPNFDGVIDPVAGWPDVPQLSEDAIAMGGADGPMNAQAIAVTARTKKLRQDVDSNTAAAAAAQASANAANAAAQDGINRAEYLKSLRINVRNYITTQIDGVTVNQAGIVAAVAAAKSAGAGLEWPAGTYVSNANIPDFHSVQHYGDGVIKRGGNTFKIAQRGGQTNTIYVSPAGLSTNDGLDAANPLSVTAVAAALGNYGPILGGNWVVQHAAGTYTNMLSLSGMRSLNRLVIKGPSVSYGVPTAIYDGALSADQNGMQLFTYMLVQVQDIKFQNWNTVAAASSGLVAAYYTDVYCVNVHATNCNFTGIAGDTLCHLYVQGGTVSNCQYGIRAYGETNYIIGYGGQPTTITGCTGAGFYVRDSSAGDILGCTINGGNAVGVLLTNQSRARISTSTITGNTVGVQATVFSTYYNDGSNTISGNTTDFSLQYSIDNSNVTEYTFDPVNKRHRWGNPTTNPAIKYYFKNGASGSSLSSGAQLTFEDAAPIIGLAGSGTGNYGIQCMKPGNANYSYFLYVSSDNTWRMNLNGTESYRWGNTAFYPQPDNAVSFGIPSSRVSVVYAGSSTINTSDGREKTKPLPIDEAVLDAWGDVQLIAFQWLESIRDKGKEARLHFGVIAQQVRDTFIAHGLDGTRYGLLCYDQWDDIFEPIMAVRKNEDTGQDEEYDTGEKRIAMPAGDRWGIRPDQCLFVEAAYQRREAMRVRTSLMVIEQRLAALEAVK